MNLDLIILIYFSLFLSSLDSELTSLCQSVLEDFNLCLFYLPSPPNPRSTSEDEEEYESGYSFLPDLLIFRMVIICLMSVHSLKRAGNQCFVWKFCDHPAAQLGWRCCLNWRSRCGEALTSSVSLCCLVAGSKQYSAAIAFTLALFSHLINHVNIRLQAELEEGENPVPAFQSDGTGKRTETAALGSHRLPAYSVVFPLSPFSPLGMGFVVQSYIDLSLLLWNPQRWVMC